ncbi:MAG TPA: amino acid ABC transporter substrate-binding protein [Candidatus Merdenecus merdavium]|nr:amino acid ABC transporter substrate-binding protein [Candidatus Merdenecus merdavium]
MKNKILSAVLATAMAVTLLVGCGNGDDKKEADASVAAEDTSAKDTAQGSEESSDKGEEDDQSLEYIKSEGKFIFGFDEAFPPMGFTDEDQNHVGFDIDVAKEVTKRMGVELELRPISWKAKETELSAKNIDCIWNGLSINEERKEQLTLSDPYMLNRQVIVTLADSDIETLDDLAGKKVVLQNGSTAQTAVDNNPNFKESIGDLTQVEDNIQAMMDLKIGGSDAVVMDEVVAKYYMELEPNKGQYKLLDETLSDEEYAIGFRKGEVALANEINKILKEMKEDGSLAKISNDWFGEDITIVNQ